MSTKIYNGFKIEFEGLMDLNKKIREFQTEALEYSKNKINQNAVQRATAYLDRKILDLKWDGDLDGTEKDYTGYTFLGKAYSKILDAQYEIKNTRRNPSVDCSLDIVIYPTTDNLAYGQIFCEGEELKNIFYDKEFVSEYCYWDNTDPDDVTEQEWDERERVWDNIFENSGIPAEIGITFTLIPEVLIQFYGKDWRISKKDYKKYLVDYDKRVNYYLEEIARVKFVNLHKDKIDPTKAYTVIMKCKEWMETSGKKEVEKIKKDITNKLIKNISFENLMEKI